MKLHVGRTLMLLVGLSAAIFAGSAQAQVDLNSYFYIAHAASGRQYNGGNPALPVDISLNGTCISKGQSFGDILGPFSAPGASFTFDFSAANSVDPCSNPTLYSFTKSAVAGTTYIAVLTLNSSNALTSLVYTADLSSVMAGRSRILVINATQSSLTAVLKNATLTQTANLAAGALGNFLPGSGMYTASAQSGTTTIAGPIDVNLLPRNVNIFVFAGSTSNVVQLFGPKVIFSVF